MPVPTTNQAPVANAGQDQTVLSSNLNTTIITLNGSGTDSDGQINRLDWYLNDILIAGGPNPQVELALGVQNLTLIVTDDRGLTAQDTVTITVLPSPLGTGLRGQYYDTADVTTGFKFFRLNPTINFNWAGGAPDPAIAADTFSVRWTGKVEPLYSETYTFSVTHNDGARLWVNGQQLINNWVNRTTAVTSSGTITLAAGVQYDINLEYYENSVAASVILEWSSPTQARQVIPASQLYAPQGQLAFTGRTAGVDEVYVFNPDGTGELNLSNNPAQDNYSAWSPVAR